MTSLLSSNNKKKRILFVDVDDEPDLISLLEMFLERGIQCCYIQRSFYSTGALSARLTIIYCQPTNIPGSSSISSIRSCHCLIHWIGIISIILGNLFGIYLSIRRLETPSIDTKGPLLKNPHNS